MAIVSILIFIFSDNKSSCGLYYSIFSSSTFLLYAVPFVTQNEKWTKLKERWRKSFRWRWDIPDRSLPLISERCENDTYLVCNECDWWFLFSLFLIYHIDRVHYHPFGLRLRHSKNLFAIRLDYYYYYYCCCYDNWNDATITILSIISLSFHLQLSCLLSPPPPPPPLSPPIWLLYK